MSTLKGTVVPPPKLIVHPISEDLLESEGFHHLQTYNPGMGLLCEIKNSQDVWLDHGHRVIWAETSSTKGSIPVDLQIERNIEQKGQDVQFVSGFRKITHLVDPVTWMQGKYSIPKQPYLPGHTESWVSMSEKLQDPMNQAYVEALANYSFSRLREGDYTPHFHKFYGSFCAVADVYRYDITDSYLSYRHKRWFWENKEKNVFSIGLEDSDIPQETSQAILAKPEDLYDSDDEENSEGSHEEELTGLDCEKGAADSGSIHSAALSDLETVKDGDSDEDDEDDDDDESEDTDELKILADIQKFPVMILYTEASEGTMDDLLEDFDEVGARPGTSAWETRWKAWVFQVLAALSVGQSIFGFTHNDLHSNNIVWSKTDQEYLYYSCRDGMHFKVPTFGKIFKIIDFGRSIFRVNQTLFFSDDFRPGNDAAEQYNFGEIYDPEEDEVEPNPSFDLCRFTVSVFEGIFPSSPAIKKKPSVLSQEEGLKMLETESLLYNVMWSWLLCDDGHNVLMDPSGKERYPDFELYKVIAAQVHNAIPSQQFKKNLFAEFCCKKKSIPQGNKIYSLFC